MRKDKRRGKDAAAEYPDIERTDNGMEKKKRRKRKKAPVIIAVIVILLVALRIAGGLLVPDAGTMVTTTQAVLGDIQDSVSASGTVSSEEVRVIFAPANGVLSEINVEAGDAVKAGDLLISYDMEQQERALRSAALQLDRSMAGYNRTLADNTDSRAKLNEANINLEVLNQQIADHKAYLKNLQDSLTKSQRDTSNALEAQSFELQQKLGDLTPGTEEYRKISSQLESVNYQLGRLGSSDYVVRTQQEISDVQEQLAAFEEYKLKMESQKTASEATILDSYARTQLDVDREMANLSYQEAEEQYYAAKEGITAEFDGIVTACTAIPGESVVSGTRLLTLENSGKLRVTFDASQYELAKLELGQQADVVIFGSTYHGEISKINRMADRNVSNTPMVGVEVHLLDADDRIILGMDAKLTVYTQKSENALLIPVEVINADRDGDFLYCVENGVIVRKPIVCGISTDLYTEVLDGITQEDVIVLNAYGDLKEGMAVTVLPEGMDEALTGENTSGLTLSITAP